MKVEVGIGSSGQSIIVLTLGLMCHVDVYACVAGIGGRGDEGYHL